MTRYLLCVAVAVASVASAQSPLIGPCGGVQSCTAVGIPDGGQVQLGGVLQSSRYATPDGGSGQVRLEPLTTGLPLAVLGNQSRTSTRPDVVIGGLTATDAGTHNIVEFVTGGYTIASLNSRGVLSSAGLVRPQDGGNATPLVQFGYRALADGDGGVTFTKAFSSLPSCVCTHVATTNANPCVISTAPTVSAVGFSSQSAGTDVIHWHCIGDL